MPMLKDEQLAIADPIIKVTQQIAMALAGGVLIVTVVIISIVGFDQLVGTLDLMSTFVLGFGVITVVMSCILPGTLGSNMAVPVVSEKEKDLDGLVEGLARCFQTKKIIQMALIEGAAFANIILLLATKCAYQILFAAIALAILVLAYPSSQSAYDWITKQAERAG